MRLIEERPSHWYRRDGSPCYEVPKKSGDGMKAVTVREARELALLPSVTNVLSVLNKPQLNDWRCEQAVIAAITLPRLPGESDDAFAKRVVVDMEAQVGKAADFGSRIHAAIADYLLGAKLPEDPQLLPYLEQFRAWADSEVEEIIAVEKVVVNLDYGYAGRLDLYADLKGLGPSVIDFKTQKIRNGKPAFYDEWFLQLSAYAFAQFNERRIDVPKLVSIVIDSQAPGPVFCQQWEKGYEGLNLFLNAFELWKHQKRYVPSEYAPKDVGASPKS